MSSNSTLISIFFVCLISFTVIINFVAADFDSGNFKGPCFFEDHFGACPDTCKGEGAQGGHCHDFKCICDN